jgi:uncharacterized protein DUF6152
MIGRLLTVLAVASGLLIASPMFAHHASSNYDREHPLTLTGTVTEFEFSNPHVLIHFDVKEADGSVSHWVAQSGPPKGLFKVGWNRESLKPGDSITVTGFPEKNGRKAMSVRNLKPPKGEDLTVGAE